MHTAASILTLDTCPGSNGANLSFPKEFGIDGIGADEWIVGLVNAIIFLTAGLMCVVYLPSSSRPSL